MTAPFIIRPMSREAYAACLRDLIITLVQVHGEMTVGECHQRVNEAIAAHGIDRAAAAIREAAAKHCRISGTDRCMFPRSCTC